MILLNELYGYLVYYVLIELDWFFTVILIIKATHADLYTATVKVRIKSEYKKRIRQLLVSFLNCF